MFVCGYTPFIFRPGNSGTRKKILSEITLRPIFLLFLAAGHRTLGLSGNLVYGPHDFKALGTWQWPGFLLFFSYCGELQLRLLWFYCKFWVCFADKPFVAGGIYLVASGIPLLWTLLNCSSPATDFKWWPWGSFVAINCYISVIFYPDTNSMRGFMLQKN